MEEILRAKCILHVIDASNPDRNNHIKTVLGVLKEIGADDIPVMTVYNKSDKLDSFEASALNNEDAFIISAKNSEGIEKLLEALEKRVAPKHSTHKINLGFDEQKLISQLYKYSNVKSIKYKSGSIALTIECSDKSLKKIKDIIAKQQR
jgi:GTP-binding protein HflX